MLTPIVLAAALMNAAMVTASAVSTILIVDAMSPSLSGLPNAAAVLGTAAGAVAVGRWTVRLGRSRALQIGYAGGVAGAALTVLAAVATQPGLLIIGMFVLGLGNAASLLSRYAAADAVPAAQRARAMSMVVWGSTIGASGSPFLMAPSQSVARALRLPALAGPFLITLAAVFIALVVATYIPTIQGRSEIAVPDNPDSPDNLVPRRARVTPAVGVMVVGHVLMVLVMTAVPVHAHHHGTGLGLLGVMLSAHTLGMFALSPLTGWWLDRTGPRPVMLTGLALLVASAVLVVLSGAAFAPALFLLGYAWNLCYLGGSAQLPAALESRVDSSIWTVAAVATGLSPWLFTVGGFLLLSAITVAMAVPLLALVLRQTGARRVPVRL
ncbi:MFS transporter [Kribbella sp. NBC_01505]|uniref:MFS transporter n=1 Tax=Kribbella sp. NBC_01505 TaxID=2903580 RepID=UPI00386F2CCB